jgi:glycine hydroxymethyltransferase
VEGNLAAAFVEQITPNDIGDLKQGEWQAIVLLERYGRAMSPALIQRPEFGHHRYRVIVPSDRSRRVVAWLRHLSDGYVHFDDADLWAKLPGPVVVRDLGLADESIDASTSSHLDQATSTPPLSHKPYFIGLSAAGYDDPTGEPLPRFEWEPPERPPRQTPLFDWHVGHGAKMAPFAGWEMPLWYTSISDEHRAVRGAAGLFDVSHMGLLEINGPHAAYFLNLVTTNDANALRPGQSQYAYLLNPDGRVIDDIMVYMLSPARYLVVVNAANTEKDWAWLNAVNHREVQIDGLRPWVRTSFQAELRDLHDPRESYAWLAEVALQGPRSRDILLALLEVAPPSSAVDEIRGRLLALERTGVMEAQIPSDRAPGGVFDLIIARTGYTGERMSFELFVHPDVMGALWERLLEIGAPFGLRPIGLGARDSLRIEAGLPLYGHELGGTLEISQNEAGFGYYCKYHKPWFVGRDPYKARNDASTRGIARFQVDERGARALRGGEPVVNRRGRVIGQVTSCALVGERQVGMALVEARYATPGTALFIYPETRHAVSKAPEAFETGDTVALPVQAEVLPRFPEKG